jgi:N-methylhydantoinase B
MEVFPLLEPVSESAGVVSEGRLDPITFEVLRHKLDEIISEAYYTMGRVSGSPVVYEAGDHQEAICTPSGDAAVFGAGVLHWVCSLGAGVRHITERYSENPGFEEDDQFILNDPYIAAVHGPDLQLLAPVIWEGELIAWAACASHQADIGGLNPGSLCVSATDVFQEGFLTPGLKLVERGVIRRDVEDTLRNLIRTPELGLLDVRAKIAANNVVKHRLGQLLERYGPEVVKTLFRQLLDYADQRVRARLRSIPDGKWTSENSVEGIREDYVRVQVTLTKAGDTLKFDFSGSSPQVESSLNIGPVGTRSSALNPFVAMLCHDLPWNEGLFRACEFELPERSVVNPQRPAALSTNVPAGANLLVLTTCHNSLSKMLLGADPELRQESCGNCGGGHNTFVLAGARSDGEFFAALILDGNGGGGGGFPDRDGPDTASNHWAVKAVITNVESVELLYPFLYLWRQEVVDSGGPGKFRGGLGLMEAVIPWDIPQMTSITLGAGYNVRSSLGYSGGYPAPHSPAGVVRGADVTGRHFAVGKVPRSLADLGGEDERVVPKSLTTVMATDVLYGYVGSGGGGFGDPLERDPAHVLVDVEIGSVTSDAARGVYGVIIAGTPRSVDGEGTENTRAGMRRQRLERMRS